MSQKILITDDSPTVLEMMKQALAGEGFSVITAKDGQEALEKARNQKPDLIVLDLMLPKIDGYKVCAMLKFDDKYKDIPIILLTARAGEADKKMGEEVRADAYITKPFDQNILLGKIKELLQKK